MDSVSAVHRVLSLVLGRPSVGGVAGLLSGVLLNQVPPRVRGFVTEILAPLVPCGTCPYRKDVPSGVWDEAEYRKLPEYDKETGQQPYGVFLCHQKDGHVCAGWAAVHDMHNCLGLRLAVALGHVSEENADAIREYKTNVPLFENGSAAAANGLRGIKRPSVKARRMISALIKTRTERRKWSALRKSNPH